MSTAEALATELGGYIVATMDDGGPIIIVHRTDRVDVISCLPSGSVRLNGIEIGMFSQGAEALAANYRALVDRAVA